ncbi:dienelactone hydrolase family protein [Marinobacterium sp. D7]|uniref:dienelactone hydrolase family protein n=1 Tax=Marinobacterium ramblicola TaxID=2849041 RepID=UPI001C2D5B48|nr:dienelactone hydrolase family protein [Marinobacterium ramblicola]MBV1790419.1 dienelactone hydrolase family protein [Marinobacterium ramblicola]
MNAKWIDIPNVGKEGFSGYLSLPPTGRGPGILLIQEIWGVNSHIRAVADQYALDGYVVLAPDLFWRQQPRVDLGYDDAGRAEAMALRQQVDDAQAGADMAAAAEYLKSLPEVEGAVAAIGYCLGGQLAYRVAAAGSVDAAVAYYGGGIQNNLELAEKITQPILFHYAELDRMIPAEAVGKVKISFAGRDNATFFDYLGVDHGFNCWGRPAYNQKAAARAHGRTLTFLSEHL